MATALATIAVFKNDILELLKGIVQLKWNDATRYALAILISMFPVFIIGVFFKDQIETFFTGNLLLVGIMLMITGGLLFYAHHKKEGKGAIGYGSALMIGVAQAMAVLPGISRSGATIATGLILGIERSKAARFSFLMVLVPILALFLM